MKHVGYLGVQGLRCELHLAGREGGRLDDGLLPTAKPDAKEPTGWILDRWDDRLEEYAPGWPAADAAAVGVSELRGTSGEGLSIEVSVLLGFAVLSWKRAPCITRLRRHGSVPIGRGYLLVVEKLEMGQTGAHAGKRGVK